MNIPWDRLDLVSTAEVARRLGIARENAAGLIRRGKLRAIKVANTWLVRRQDLEEFAKSYVKGPGRRKPTLEKGGQE